MEKRQVEVGKEYALREPPKPGVPFQHVRVIELVRGGKWRVEWIEPNPGLVDFVASKNIVVRWSQRAAFLRDEDRAASLARTVADTFPGEDSPLAAAVDDVLASTGESDLTMYRGVLRYDPDAYERVAQRARITPPEHTSGYQDRHGQHYLPFECALALASAFAAAEPRTVLDHVDIEERRTADEAREPGNGFLLGLLNEYRASWALVRQWAGHDVAVAAREDRIAELHRLLTQVMWDLRGPNPDVERISNRIERAIRR